MGATWAAWVACQAWATWAALEACQVWVTWARARRTCKALCSHWILLVLMFSFKVPGASSLSQLIDDFADASGPHVKGLPSSDARFAQQAQLGTVQFACRAVETT